MNFQKPIFFCVLLVTVTAQPSHSTTIPGADLSATERFDTFGKFLNDSVKAVQKYSIIHLKDTSAEFQANCLQTFENKMRLNSLDYNSENVDEIIEMAFQAFEETVKNTIRGFQRSVMKCEPMLYQLEWILENGDVLHFLSYLVKLEIPENDLKNEMRKIQKGSQDLTEVEARWSINLNKYNKGQIINDYPKPCGGGGRLRKMLSFCCGDTILK